MTKYFPLILFLMMLFNNIMNAQNQAPANPQELPVIIKGASIHTGDGKLIENGTIVFDKGIIAEVTTGNPTVLSSDQLKNATIINASGKHVYPGLIALNTNIGLSEIESIRASNDFAETGQLNASARTVTSYNTDSRSIPTVRSNGVLLAQAVPQGGLISGLSAVMQLDAWNWEDAVVKADDGLHVNWPSMRINKASWASPEEEQQKRMERNLDKLYSFFKEARSYCHESKPAEVNLQFESMRPVFSKSRKVYVHCNFVKEIVTAVSFCKEQNVEMVLVGGSDSWQVTKLLKENNIPVVIERTHQVPSRMDEAIDLPYSLPALLSKAGLLFAISETGFWQQSNLPFQAGQAVSYGLSKEDAIKSITLNAARVLGIDAITGSIEKGKQANLLITTGDLLDMKSNQIEHAFIQGRSINLDNAHKQLYRKYCQKYGITF